MGKPKSSKSSYTSAGIHSNVARGTLTAMKKATYAGDKMKNKFEAYLKSQNPWMTIANPNKTQTNKRFIKVRYNEYYGDPKDFLRGIVKKEEGAKK